MPSLLSLPRQAVAFADALPRHARTAERRAAEAFGTLAAMADDLSVLRRALEPVGSRSATIESDLGTLVDEVRAMREDLDRVNAQLADLRSDIPDLKPDDGLLSRARDAVTSD